MARLFGVISRVGLVERADVVLGLGELCLFVAYTKFAGLATETRFSFSTAATCGRRRGRGRARVRLPALIAWFGRARGRAGGRAVVVLEVVPTNSMRVATAALADPLLRKFGAVDRREAFTDSYGEQRRHTGGAGRSKNETKRWRVALGQSDFGLEPKWLEPKWLRNET